MISSAADLAPDPSELAATGLLAADVAGSPAMKQVIVVFNSGSTSLKFGAYGVNSASDPAVALSLIRAGRIDSMQGDPHFVVKDAAGKPLDTHE